MKAFLANHAKHFRRFAVQSSGKDLGSIPPPAPFPGENHGFESRAKSPSPAIAAMSSIVSKPTNSLRSPHTRVRQNEMQNARSIHPEFITREELKRELDFVRRLIESRK